MFGFSDLLRMILDDPDAFNSKISTQLYPNLVDQLTAYLRRLAKCASPANRPESPGAVYAVSCRRRLARTFQWSGVEGNFSAAPLTFILEHFLTISLDPSRQRLIEGPEPPSILNQFRRMPE